MVCCPIVNVVISNGTPKQTWMNSWQKTNVKHFINTPYYNRRYTKLKIEEYDRKERNVTD